MLLKGNAALILGEPFIEGLQPRVQPTSDLNVASAAVDFIEVALEPELVAQIRRQIVVPHLERSRIPSQAALLQWVRHLATKGWMDTRSLAVFIDKTAQAQNLKIWSPHY
jgi:hypothetical protein